MSVSSGMTQDSAMRMYPLAAFFRDSFVKHAFATARLTQAIEPSVSQLLSRHLVLLMTVPLDTCKIRCRWVVGANSTYPVNCPSAQC